MKKTLFFIVGISILVLTMSLNQSCDKLKDSITTDIDVKPNPINFDIPSIKIPKASTRANHSIDWERSFTLPTEVSKSLKKSGFSFDNVKNFSINEISIKVKNPADYDVKGLIGTKVFLGNPAELYAEAIKADGKSTLVFNIIKNDVQKFLKQDNISVKVTGPAVQGEFPSVNVDLFFKFKINVAAL